MILVAPASDSVAVASPDRICSRDNSFNVSGVMSTSVSRVR